jgi:atypical dual specificity phosphatase
MPRRRDDPTDSIEPSRPHRAHRFSWVVPGRVVAMGRPSSDELAALRAAGVTRVISLTGAPLAPELLRENGLVAFHLPLADLTAPSMEQVAAFVAALTPWMDSGEKVAVHCGAGLGRTGTMLACYLVSRGMPAEKALREVRKRRPGSVESREQEEAVHEYAARLASQ